MKTSDMAQLVEETLAEWLDGAYWEENPELADYIGLPTSQKIQRIDDPHDILYRNRETSQVFRLAIAVYEEGDEA